MYNHSIRALVASTALAIGTLTAHAATVTLKAELKSASEVPPKETSGGGTLSATLDTDTNELKYHVVYSGLTGPVSAAHFHGPAGEGVNAKPQVPVKGPYETTINGSATITDFNTSQNDKIDIADLLHSYNPLTDAIADFVQLTTSGSNTLLKVDIDGAGTAHSPATIATIQGVTGLDLNTLITDHHLIVTS